VSAARLTVDRDQLAAFVGAMFRHADEGTFASLRTFLELEEGPPPAIRAIELNGDPAQLIEATICQAQRAAELAKACVFAPPISTFSNPKKAREIDLANGLALSVEIDSEPERSRKRLEFLIGPATAVVASGGEWIDPQTGEVQDKLHLHWRLKEPTRTPEAHARLKQARTIATQLVGGDCTNKPIVHPIRWPGSWHRKGEPKLCRIVTLNAEAEIDLHAALATLLDVQPEFRGPGGAAGGRAADPGEDRETAELIRRVMTGEEYHAALRDLAWRYVNGGMAPPQVVVTLRGLMEAGTGPHDERWQKRRGQIPMLVTTAQEKLAAAQGSPTDAGDDTWPEPAPLPAGLPPVEPFPLDLLPAALRPWVEDVAERMQVPPDYVAVAAMTALGSALGRQIGIYPKRHDDWLVVPNLWGAVIGPPGQLKSPALAEALWPLTEMEKEAREAYEAAIKAWAARSEVERAIKRLRADKIKRDLKANRSADAIAQEVAQEQDERPTPVRRRFMTNDPTVEKLGELLRDNPNGVLVSRDELIGWLRNMEREGRQGDRSFYLEAWNGSGRFTYDRIERGTVDIEAACVSVLGGIQPGPLLSYLEAKAWGGAGDDGLLQRFQLAVWPDTVPVWRNVDRWPNDAARERAATVFRRLAAITRADAGAHGKGRIPGLRFNDRAQDAFDAWRNNLEARLRKGNLHPAFEAHLSKYRSLLPSLALICHLADGGAGPVGEIAFARAEAWASFLEPHAERIYSTLVKADQAAARTLGEHIENGDLPSPFTLRDVYRPCWAGLTTREAAQEAVDVLCDLGWLRADEAKPAGRGRPPSSFHINPAARRVE
jgi:putative DNA primase/helicase